MSNSTTDDSSQSSTDGTIAPEDFEEETSSPEPADGTISAEGFEDALAPIEQIASTAEGPDFRGPLSADAPDAPNSDLLKKYQQPIDAYSVSAVPAGLSAPGALASKIPGVDKLEKLGAWGAAGANALKGAVEAGLFQTADEVTQWAQGKGDPQDPVGAALAHVGVAFALGLGAGAAGSAAQIGLRKLADESIGAKAKSFLAGLGSAAEGVGETGAADFSEGTSKTVSGSTTTSTKWDGDKGAFEKGKKAFARLVTAIGLIKHEEAIRAAHRGYDEGGIEGAIKSFVKTELVGHLAGAGLKLASRKMFVPLATKMLTSGKFVGTADALEHISHAAAGSEAINQSIDYALKGGARAAAAKFGRWQNAEALDKDLQENNVQEQLQQEMYNQAQSPQGFAHGGEVKGPSDKPGILQQQSGIATHYPEQNVLLAAAKGRVSNYLTSLRPSEHRPKLAFDEPADGTEQRRTYHKALAVAANPLGILDEIRQGTLDPAHVAHFKSMYPETDQLLQKRLATKLTEIQVAGEKPSYKTRQGLSLLMGANLSGEVAQPNLAAAQAVFVPKQQSQQSPAPQSKTSSLTKSGAQASTPDQARQERQQVGK